MCQDENEEHYHLLVKFLPYGKVKQLHSMKKSDAKVSHIKQQIIDYYYPCAVTFIKLFWENEEILQDDMFIRDICIHGKTLSLYGPHTNEIIIASIL